MFAKILIGVCLVGMVSCLAACAFISQKECARQAFARLRSRLGGRAWPLHAFVALFALHMFVYGSTKTPGGGSPNGGGANGLAMMLAPGQGEQPFESGFTDAETGAGYVVWRVGTNETWSFDMPQGGSAVSSWRRRGASDDWTAAGPRTMLAGGEVVADDVVYSALGRPMSLAPEANWSLVDATNGCSMAWHGSTSWEATVFGWRNGLLDRGPGTPVSTSVEISREGDVLFRYDFSRAGDAATNCVASIARGADRVSVPLDAGVSSVLFYRLRPKDLTLADRDGDGISTWDEINTYRTDPGLADTDGDGLDDGAEIAHGTDPTQTSVPNAEIVARVAGSATNEAYQAAETVVAGSLVAWKLWDGFAAEWPASSTNLVYERTVGLGAVNGWQHFFLSSEPDGAGGWDLRGLELQWDDGLGSAGTVRASPVGDSLYLPLTNESAAVTIRLAALGPQIRAAKPMYLLAYAPAVSYGGCRSVCDAAGNELALVARREAGSPIVVAIDRSARPSASPLNAAETLLPGLDDIEETSSGALRFSGDAGGGTLEILRTGLCELPGTSVAAPAPGGGSQSPSGGTGRALVLLDPSVRFAGDHAFAPSALVYDAAEDAYSVTNRYPLDSACLWRNWLRDATGRSTCSCAPVVSSGADGLSCVRTDSVVTGDTLVGSVYVYDQLVWTGSARHFWREFVPGVTTDAELLSEIGACDPCADDCADGLCDAVDGPSLNSVKFRLSLGSPRAGQHSGFVCFAAEQPVAVAPALFRAVLRPDAQVSVSTNGTCVTYACADARGRDIALDAISDGVRLTVSTHATGALEYVWEVTNVGGDAAEIRIRETSRLGNVMRDVSYACEEGVWSETDNVTGVREVLSRLDGLSGAADGVLREWRSKYAADDSWLGTVYTESRRVGIGANAVLRETYWQEDAGAGLQWRAASYWDDAAHGARHGRVRLVRGNTTDWVYRDYDADGFEVLRVEQRDGSPVPGSFPFLADGELAGVEGLTNAWLTVADYAPLPGDDGDAEDNGKPRCETRYVVRRGQALLVGRTWHRYTREIFGGMSAVRHERWRAARADAQQADPDNAYSCEVTLSETSQDVPLTLRGRVAEARDEDGVVTSRVFSAADGRIVEEARASFDGHARPTYARTERDATHGTVLREATLLAAGDVVVDDRNMSYDEKNRLRSTAYSDGTSETNAYSCCRLLWSSDRLGRRRLRSALTGRDRLYFAEEDVWLRDVSTNGLHQVTQHFMDGLGRETNVVTYVAETAGEATNWTASAGRRLCERRTLYPGGAFGCSETIDARGGRKVSLAGRFEDRTEFEELAYASAADDAPQSSTRTIHVRGGATAVERTWDGKWTRETTAEDYDASGRLVRCEICASSDYGVQTNRVVLADFLGRTIRDETPLGATETTYHGASGRVASMLFTAGAISRTAQAVYDACGARIGTVCDGVSSLETTEYAADAADVWWRIDRRIVCGTATNAVEESRTRLTGLGAEGLVSETVATSAAGVVTRTRAVRDPETASVATTSSNAVAGVSARTERYGLLCASDGASGVRRFAYDDRGRRVSVTRGAQTRPEEMSVYNAAGDCVARLRATNATDYATERFVYDAAGRCVSFENALGETVGMRYDAVGNRIETSGAAYPVRCTYDTAGRRTSLSTTRDGIIWDVTSWTYDPSTGRCVAKRYADDSQVTRAYAADGLPSETVAPSGAWTRSAYDGRRLLAGTTSQDGSADAAFAYDEFGRMTSASNGVATYAYARHAGGTATNECLAVGTNAATYVRRVDALGRLVGRGFADGDAQTVAYDGRGRVAAVSDATASVAYAYDAEGNETGCSLVLSNGLVVTRQIVRDAFRPERVLAVTNRVNGVAVDAFAYGHDALGRVVSRNADAFGYDARGQVSFARIQVPDGDALETQYGYDDAGNFAAVATGTNTSVYAANALNQYASAGGTAQSSLADGGAAALGDRSLSYDAAGRLARMESGGAVVEQSYDAFGRRVRRTAPASSASFLYDGWNLVREISEGPGGLRSVTDYRWSRDASGTLDGAGGVGALLYLVRDGSVYVPLYDANGNVTAYVDGSGSVVARYVYDAFGRAVSTSGAQAEDFRFRYATKYHEPEAELDYYGYRFYSPACARWLTRDPLEEEGGVNLYAFCANDAVNSFDSLGLFQTPTVVPDDPRYFWCSVSESFKYVMNWTFAAELLGKSLTAFDRTRPVVFASGHSVVWKIKSSSEYAAEIRRLIRSKPAGLSRVQDERGDIEFLSGDLYAAAKKVKVTYAGYVCRPISGADRVALEVTVSDRYDFAWWSLSDTGVKKDLLRSFVIQTGNNLAYLDQVAGVIRPFDWEVRFKESGRWPR